MELVTHSCHLMARARSQQGQGDQAKEIFHERIHNWSELVVFLLHGFSLIHNILCYLSSFWKGDVIWSQGAYLSFFSRHLSVLGRTSFLSAVHHVYLGLCSLLFILQILLLGLLFTCFPTAPNCNTTILYLPLCWSHGWHIYVKCLYIVFSCGITVLQNAYMLFLITLF